MRNRRFHSTGKDGKDVSEYQRRAEESCTDQRQKCNCNCLRPAALFGNDVATFPDYPAEIRAPQGTVGGVSGFQVHIGEEHITTPGDYADVLVAMNPAALKANLRWAKKAGTIIVDIDAFTDKHIERAGYTAKFLKSQPTT